jgi:hypothetical protein
MLRFNSLKYSMLGTKYIKYFNLIDNFALKNNNKMTFKSSKFYISDKQLKF